MNEELMDRQLELERDMQTVGKDAYWKHVNAAKASGREASTKYGNKMVMTVIEPMAHSVEAFVAQQAARSRGPKRTAYHYLKDADPRVVSYITAKIVFNCLSSAPIRVTPTALAIGWAIHDEARFQHFEQECKPLWRKLRKDLDRRTSSRPWQRTVLIHSMGKAKIQWQRWPKEDVLHLGVYMLGVLIKNNPWVRQVTRQLSRKKRSARLEITKEGSEFVRDRNARCEMLSPRVLPMLVPPRAWTGPKDGGYYTLTWDTTVIKTTKRYFLEELSFMDDQLVDVYAALNAVQSVPWVINKRVFEVLQHVYEKSLPLGNLPAMENDELPTKPVDIDTNEKARRKWRRAAAQVHGENTVRASKAFQVGSILSVSQKYMKEAAIYFVHTFDFRGRLYAMGPLSPQGPDYTKALLKFAVGKPITEPVALGRLMIHGANCYGYDKVSLEERITWVAEHEDDILRCADGPLDHKFWADADEPWQFLAFCFEYAAFQAHGWGFVSSLPCTQDGSCNGLQHFSAMLRDKIGGAAVNLVPSDKPSDIYATVMDKVKAQLRSAHWDDVAKMGGDKKVYDKGKMAREWLRLNPDRKLSKRPVMTLPYGATRHSCREYVEDWLLSERTDHPFKDEGELFAATLFMSRLIWDAIGDTVIAAKEAMSWLKQAAWIAARDGIPVNWTTPDGFPVLQSYENLKKRRVKTQLGDSTLFLTLAVPAEGIDNAKQASGISPNFVHSLDATVLRRYVLLAKYNGIDNFGLVHDSFGTVAADAELSSQCQRVAFIDVYQNNNVLEDFRRDIAEGMSPENASKLMALDMAEQGDLVLASIIDQNYFSA